MKLFFPKIAYTWKNPREIYILWKAFSWKASNLKKNTIKIISINRKTEAQQTTALRFSSSVLTVAGKSNFHFSKVYNINGGLEPNIPGS